MLRLNEKFAAAIRAHGVETYPHECCGAILGRDAGPAREVVGLVPLANRRDDSPRNRFEITADDVRLAEKKPGSWVRPGRLVSFTSRRSGAAQRVRSGTCLAVVQLHHRQH
jgi:hypothetical protein